MQVLPWHENSACSRCPLAVGLCATVCYLYQKTYCAGSKRKLTRLTTTACCLLRNCGQCHFYRRICTAFAGQRTRYACSTWFMKHIASESCSYRFCGGSQDRVHGPKSSAAAWDVFFLPSSFVQIYVHRLLSTLALVPIELQICTFLVRLRCRVGGGEFLQSPVGEHWQVLLPSSVGTSLLQQGASVNGAPFFHVQTPSGASTHVGVLSYEAAEGTIALPPKVVRRCVTCTCSRLTFTVWCPILLCFLARIVLLL